MYFMAQKRVLDVVKVAFMHVEEGLDPEDHDKGIDYVKPILWKLWETNPEKWVVTSAGAVGDDEMGKLHESPWHFAVFVIDRLPVGKVVETTILSSAFYYLH